MKFINKKTIFSLFLLSTCMILSSCGQNPNPPVDSCAITWLNDDGTILKKDNVKYGDTPSYSESAPSKSSTAQFDYTFSGWLPEITTATGPVSYVAQYTPVVKKYKITWLDDDDKVLKSENLPYGLMPSFGANPTKPSDQEFDYTFSHWDPEITKVTKDATYKATYSSAVRKYQITWLNDNGSILKTEMLPYGSMPLYEGKPSKDSTDEFTYEFSHWDPELTSVTGDTVYTAKYSATKRSYQIKWIDDDDKVLKTETVEYGLIPSYGVDPIKPSDQEFDYTFSGWSPSITKVTKDTTYKATYKGVHKSYKITWLNDDDSPLRVDTLEYGSMPFYGIDPTKPSDQEFDYTFSHWDPEITKVTKDTTYKAVYSSSKRKYQITWLNDNGSTLKTESVEYGNTPAYSGPTPTKEGTDEFTYTFSNWSPILAPVTKDTTYVAQYSTSVNSYKITWLDDNDTPLRVDTLLYGSTPIYGTDPIKPSTVELDFKFSRWNPEIVQVTQDATYKATYSSSRRSYEITWKNDNGEELRVDTLEYGANPDYGSTPTKRSTPDFDYEFSHWKPNIVPVKGPATYTAMYNSFKKHTITWLNDDDSLLKITYVRENYMPDYGSTPYKSPTDEYEYIFSGWSPTLTPAIGPATYKATYTPKKRSYDVVFKNGEEILQSERLEYGTTPVYKGPNPTREDTPYFVYTFIGWDPSIGPVKGKTTYNAQFSASQKLFNVTVTSKDPSKGTVSGGGKSPYNRNVIINATPADGCVFVGWYKDGVKVSSSPSYTFTMPASDVSYVAEFAYENAWYVKSDWWNYCSNGIAKDQANKDDIGREVDLMVNGQVHKVRLIDVDHDDLYDTSGKAHCTFEFANLLSDSDGYSLATYWNSGNGESSTNLDYFNTDLRKALDGSGSGKFRWYQKESPTKSTTYTTSAYDMLPSGLQNKIKTVKKYVSQGKYHLPTEYDAKVFALTHDEICTEEDKSAAREGTIYEYYKNHSRVKYQVKWNEGLSHATEITDSGIRYSKAYSFAGIAYGGYYHLASPVTTKNFESWCVYPEGYISFINHYIYGSALSVSPAFCI